ncbi:hypothetical protein Alg130_11471 [Pyrenophora tritici-repentis]|nr:hypothetical protein Alg130_11471 [Pyrenophora tritici-repentis]
MRNYLPLAVILLAPAVSAWNACYCAGVKARADEAARSCCTAGDGVGFPKTNSDVLGRWDQTEQVCRFAGSVLTQNTLKLKEHSVLVAQHFTLIINRLRNNQSIDMIDSYIG